jgi:sigma-B regulation protein RsbU (phosphoserine phosphatase)
MVIAPLPHNERERLEALYSLRLLDTPSEERFNSITRLAAKVFEVPIAFVSMVDRDRQWLKSRVGLEICETPRDLSFCSHAILQDAPLIIPDTHRDSRFADNPFVTGSPYLRFYAGMPLRAAEGQRVGTLCIADHQPHQFGPEKGELLREIASLVERELKFTDLVEMQEKLLSAQQEVLATRNQLEEDLAAAARYVQSLLPAPMTDPLRIDWRFVPSQQLGGDCFGYHLLDDSHAALFILDVCGHGVGAALLSVALLSTLRSQSLRQADFNDPASVLTALNREFPMGRHENRFFTIWYGVLELRTGELVYAGAGHPPAIAITSSGVTRQLRSQGIPIGCVADTPYRNSRCSLGAGESLFLFSDGVIEPRGENVELLSLSDLELLFARSGGQLDTVLRELQQLVGRSEFADDLTLLRLQMPAAAR